MSDYLGSLLARSFAPAPEVRPRSPSAFEPTAGPAALDAEPESAIGADAAGAAPASPRGPSPAASAAESSGPADDPVPGRRRPDPPPLPARRAEGAETIAAVDSSAAPPPGRPASPAPLAPKPAGQAPAVPAAAAPRPDARTAPVRERMPESPRPAVAPAAERAAAPRPVPEPAPAPERIARIPSDHAEPPAAGVTVRPIRPAREAQPPPPAPASRREAGRLASRAAAAPPTIQVTIGRVEVRAAPPAGDAPPRARKPPVMSLETYLQRRAEGNRR